MNWKIFKSKTVWFAIILAILSVVQGYLGVFDLPEEQEMMVGIAISIIVTVLRIVTTKPLSEK